MVGRRGASERYLFVCFYLVYFIYKGRRTQLGGSAIYLSILYISVIVHFSDVD